ncbi:MAG: HypC/HybG/HupF family hydrogenase formation chaperone [Chloroflexi bacterium]|nr:HypC/HybG/HupF family hydrogenase formation chaperone [Chloroflexota bacterium]
MCRAEPRRILQLQDGRLEVLLDGAPMWVGSGGMTNLAQGDYVVVYAGQAVELMDRDEAEDIIRFNEELEGLLESSSQ